MKTLKIYIFLIVAISFQWQAVAETWDEPWQKEIIQNAQYFVLAKVLSNVDSVGAHIQIIKYFGNQPLSGEVLINGFSRLRLLSASGHGTHLSFKKDQELYLFLTKKEDGNYAIPTPTSGYALVQDNNVYATYRHSYHQALVPQAIYEKTYTEIWNFYRTKRFAQENVLPFINENIDEAPAGFAEDEIDRFFLQHVALETAYLLELPVALSRLTSFIESENFHAKVSALQLARYSKDEETKEYLFEFIKNDMNENFEKVIAIWSLSDMGGEEYRQKLLSIVHEASEEQTGFGGNIMDPRVATRFPSPKGAINSLK